MYHRSEAMASLSSIATNRWWWPVGNQPTELDGARQQRKTETVRVPMYVMATDLYYKGWTADRSQNVCPTVAILRCRTACICYIAVYGGGRGFHAFGSLQLSLTLFLYLNFLAGYLLHHLMREIRWFLRIYIYVSCKFLLLCCYRATRGTCTLSLLFGFHFIFKLRTSADLLFHCIVRRNVVNVAPQRSENCVREVKELCYVLC